MVGKGLGPWNAVSTNLVNNRLKTTEHRFNALSRLLCEYLVLTPEGLTQSSLDLASALMSGLKLFPNGVPGYKVLNSIKLGTL